MLFDVKESTLDLGGVRMDYLAFGRGDRPLVMIQGLNTRGVRGASWMLAYMYRCFSGRYRVYLFDRRQDIRAEITVRELAADIAGAMDALNIAQADVLGVSQGGMIAQYLAIDRPDLVNRLVLAVTLSKNNDTAAAVIRGWIGMTERGEMKALVSDMAQKMYSQAYVKRYRMFMPLLTMLQKPKDTQRFILLAKACLTCSAYDELEKIRCPVFVIGGRQDRIVTGAASEEIAGKLGCGIHMYEQLGHAAYEEAADFNRRVFDFLQA